MKCSLSSRSTWNRPKRVALKLRGLRARFKVQFRLLLAIWIFLLLLCSYSRSSFSHFTFNWFWELFIRGIKNWATPWTLLASHTDHKERICRSIARNYNSNLPDFRKLFMMCRWTSLNEAQNWLLSFSMNKYCILWSYAESAHADSLILCGNFAIISDNRSRMCGSHISSCWICHILIKLPVILIFIWWFVMLTTSEWLNVCKHNKKTQFPLNNTARWVKKEGKFS